MATRKYTEEALLEYLRSHAELGSFYIAALGDSGSGLIYFFDSEGKNWCLMEDNDQLVAQAVEFLKKHGAPHFNEISAAQEFENNWGK